MMEPAIASTPPARGIPTEHRFEFNGSGGEYFRIWIVNLLLTLVTLGIYSAWAKVRRLRYFYGNTVLAGSAFEYHGEPKKILKGRLIAAALILPYYLLQTAYPLWSLSCLVLLLRALPVIRVQSRRFTMRMTSWRNIRFGFTGSYGGAAKVFLGLGLLIPLTLGLILPYTIFAKQRFVIGETRFGQTRFDFNAEPGRYYAAYLAAFGWFLASLIGWLLLCGLIFLLAGLVGGVTQSLLSNPREILSSPAAALVVVVGIVMVYLAFIAVTLVPAAVTKARITNEAFGHTTITTHQLQSDLQAKQLVSIYLTNLLGIVFTLGLFAPWAKVRLVRYQLANTRLLTQGSLDEFVGTETANMSAAGEELGDFLDVDFGL
jgi:uncharacterized membrane protein YjgN (DUF898 family)